MPRALPPSADRLRGQHLPLKGGGEAEHNTFPSSSKGEGQGGGDAARVCLGVITGAHGVKGRVRIKSFTAEPLAIASYGPLSDEEGERHFVVHITGEAKGTLLAELEGIDDRNAAEALRGVRLYVRRDALPELEEEEFYEADLIGLEARRRGGVVLGRVTAVHDFGAGASLEIEAASGKSVVVPFTAAAVPEIAVAAGFVIVEPPEGLFDAPPAVAEASAE